MHQEPSPESELEVDMNILAKNPSAQDLQSSAGSDLRGRRTLWWRPPCPPSPPLGGTEWVRPPAGESRAAHTLWFMQRFPNILSDHLWCTATVVNKN